MLFADKFFLIKKYKYKYTHSSKPLKIHIKGLIQHDLIQINFTKYINM